MTTESQSESTARDEIFTAFLRRQQTLAQEINGDSEIASLLPGPGELPSRYIARFNVQTFIRNPGEKPTLYTGPIDIGIHFPADYLRKAPSAERVFTIFHPVSLFHPNLRAPFVCATIHPNSALPNLMFTLWSMLTFRTIRYEHPLNAEASPWARRSQQRFPTDHRPLRGQSSPSQIEFSEVKS